MSETITVSTEAPTRQPRHPGERTMTEAAPTVAVEAAEEPRGPTPEEELAAAQAAIKARDAENATLRETATRAQREAARAHAGRATDRSAAVAGAVEAAKSAKDAAKVAKKAAREAGDIEAEMVADEAFAQATFREAQATAELATMKASEPTSAAGRTTEQQQDGYSPQARQWIGAHPKFNSDPAYKAAVLAAHGSAIADGITPDTPAYFRELDRVAASLDRPNGGEQRTNHMPNNGGFNGAPPSREGGGSGGGNVVNTLLGPVTVTQGSDGKTRLKVPPALMDDFREGAKVTNMDLGAYIMDQVNIARERASGETGSLIIREGVTYR